jgi:hypothetical protein
MIDGININELGIKNQLNEEIERYYKFSRDVLGKTDIDFDKQKEIDMRNYAKYVFREGSLLEKREILGNMESKIIMKDKKIWLKN